VTYRRRATLAQFIQELPLELEYLLAEIVGERETLGEPRRDRGPGARPVDVHLRPAAVLVLEVVAAEDEDVTLLQRVEITLVRRPTHSSPERVETSQVNESGMVPMLVM